MPYIQKISILYTLKKSNIPHLQGNNENELIF